MSYNIDMIFTILLLLVQIIYYSRVRWKHKVSLNMSTYLIIILTYHQSGMSMNNLAVKGLIGKFDSVKICERISSRNIQDLVLFVRLLYIFNVFIC